MAGDADAGGGYDSSEIVENYELRITNYELRITNYELRS